MVCHLVCVADLRTFGGVVSFSRSSYWLALGWPRLGLEVFSPNLASDVGCLLWLLGVCVSSVFSLFLVLCDLVLVKLCLTASRIICKLFSS